MTRQDQAQPEPANATSPDISAEMTSHERPPGMLTRREFVAAAAVAVTVAGCAPFGSTSAARHMPPPFRLARTATLTGDATVPTDLIAQIASGMTGVGGLATVSPVAPSTSAPDLLLTFGDAPTGHSGYSKSAIAGQSAYALATHLRVPIEEVTSAQAHALLSGQIADWHSVGAPSALPVRLLALAGLPAPSGIAFPSTAHRFPSLAALLDALRATPGSVAVVPLEALDWSLHHVGVDGVFPAQGRGDASMGGLGTLPLRLCVSDALAKAGCDPAAVGKAVPSALASAQPTVDLLAAGDIMLGRGVLNQMLARNDFSFPYRAIHDELATADLRLANLECMVTDLIAPPSDPFTFTFVCPTKGFDGLTYAGFDVVSVANNHSNGAGQQVFTDMLARLHARNIATCGGGATLAEATAPVVKTVKGARIAFLAYDNIFPQGPFATETSWGLAPIDVSRLPSDLRAARAQADIVIPYFHWGIEYTEDPITYQQTVARAAIDAGADMVLGNHPHWTQAIENYKGKLIIYSMGNFVFDQDWSEATMEGMMLHLYWRADKLVSVRFRPTLDVSRCQPRLMTPGEAVNVFNRMWTGTDMLAAGEHGIA